MQDHAHRPGRTIHWQAPAWPGRLLPTGKTRPIPREDAPGMCSTEYVTIPDAFAGCSTREGEPAPFGGGGPLAKPERHKMPKKKNKRVNQP